MKLRQIFLFSALLLSLTAFAHVHNDTIRVMTLNLHAGHDASLSLIGQFIKQHKPDFVALQEVDYNTSRTNCLHQNRKDFITELAYYSGMQGLFGPTIPLNGGLYGIGLLTRHQFVDIRNIKLPHPTSKMEQRGLLEGTFVLPEGDTIVVACTHLEAFDDVSRKAQAEYIQNHFSAISRPVIMAGDFNAPPSDDIIKLLLNEWKDCTGDAPTFSVSNTKEKIDYIFALPSHSWQVVSSEVISVKLSDHYPVIATLVLTHN